MSRRSQPPLPGLEERKALIHILNKEFTGLDVTDYPFITPQHLEAAQPENLRPSLIDLPTRVHGSLTYQSGEDMRRYRIMLTPSAFNVLCRSAVAVGEQVEMRTADRYPKSQQLAPDNRSKARRSGVHAVEGKLDAMNTRKDEVAGYLRTLAALSEMTQNPNLVRKKLDTTLETLQFVRSQVLADMLLAVGFNRGWDQEKYKIAFTSAELNTFVHPDPTQRVARFLGTMKLASEYYGHHMAILSDRIWQSKKYIRQHSGQ